MPAKLVRLALLILFCKLSYGQNITYKSHLTEYLNAQKTEWIERDISVSKEKIIITTFSDSLTDIQNFKIIENFQEEFKNVGMCNFYKCTSNDGNFITVFIFPIVEKIERIELYIPDQPGIESSYIRFHID